MMAVAPHAGARIETPLSIAYRVPVRVAPHAGARIETDMGVSRYSRRVVAPHAGARIETCRRLRWVLAAGSLPMRERELKHI